MNKNWDYQCLDCNDSGVVMVRHREAKTNAIFVCDCPIGKNSHWAVPKNIGVNKEHYVKIKFWSEADRRIYVKD